MTLYPLIAFLVLVAVGAYIQTVSGFAVALVIAGGAAALSLSSIADTANVISFVALSNILVAVHKRHSHIDRRILLYSAIGILSLSGLGLLLLRYLSATSIDLLELLLGVVILASGTMLMFRPQPRSSLSANYTFVIAGGVGGLLNGMFGAGGPPVVVHLYRQPLPFPVVRTTLLAALGFMPLVRVCMETYSGHITGEVLRLTLLSVPVSIIATIFARHFPPPVSDLTMRRIAFGLLCLIGLTLVGSHL